MAKGGPSKYTLRSAELQESEDTSLIDTASENSQSFGPQYTFLTDAAVPGQPATTERR